MYHLRYALIRSRGVVLCCFVAAVLGPQLSGAGASTKSVGKKSKSAERAAELEYLEAKELILDGKLEQGAKVLGAAAAKDPGNPYLNNELAQVYLRLGSFEQAEPYAKLAAEAEPDNVAYISTFAAVLASSKRYDEAKAQYTKILELDRDNAQSLLLLSQVEYENGSVDSALDVLGRALKSNPENYLALFYRAKIYLETDRLKDAQNDLDQCLSIRPSFVEAGVALGLLYERGGEIDKAIEVYSRIQANGTFKKRLAQLYIQKEQLDKALVELLEYETLEPDDYTTQVRIGLIHIDLKQYKKATERFAKILKKHADADNVRFYLGLAYEAQKQYPKAIAEFKKVTADSTFYKEAMLHYANILRVENRTSEGLVLARGLVKKFPDILEYYDMQASFHDLRGETTQALDVLRIALHKFDQDERLLYYQGVLLDKTGKTDAAIKNMQAVIDSNPNNPHALNFLGYTLAERGEDLDRAEKYVRRALEIRPGDAFIEDSLGWILYKKGDAEQATELLERAAKKQPQEAVILEHLADVYASRKMYDHALESYKRAQKSVKKSELELATNIASKLSRLEKSLSADSKSK